MEKLEFSFGSEPSLLAPAEGRILMVRFKKPDRVDCDTVFCELGVASNRSLQLLNCRRKSFLIDGVPCDYAAMVGNLTIPETGIVDIVQLRLPAWYHRREEGARRVARQSSIAALVRGILEEYAETAG